MDSYVALVEASFYPKPEDDLMESFSQQIRKVVVESLITSFGLDFLIQDQYGGDVDTIHNVREIDKNTEKKNKDEVMCYKNEANSLKYENHGKYDSTLYHKNDTYIAINRNFSEQKKIGVLKDSYTGLRIKSNEKTNLDHVISAKEIHEDRGRVLSGIDGTTLANCEENLKMTRESINKSKNKDSMDEFLNRLEERKLSERLEILKSKEILSEREKKELNKLEQLTSIDIEKAKNVDKESRKSYERKIAYNYYLSEQFRKDTLLAAGNVGMRMGLRQAIGFIFVEVWFAVEDEFKKLKEPFDLERLLVSIGNGMKEGFHNAKIKYRALLAKFGEGVVAGIFSSVSTTICNIFFTTGKNAVKILRRTYISLVQAAEVLFINPDNYLFGDRMRAGIKILATGASVAIGTIVADATEKLVTIPVVGEIVSTFCGTFVTGIMTCVLLYYFDRSKLMNQLVYTLNSLYTIDVEIAYYKQQAIYFEKYAAELMQIDIKEFEKETKLYCGLVNKLEKANDEEEVNDVLKTAIKELGIKLPWEGEFNSFMRNKETVLVFE